jgi:cholesterol transport system auxiliary component
MKRTTLIFGAAILLGGCSLGLTGKAPDFLLTLTPTSSPTANDGVLVQAGDSLTVSVPLAPQSISTTRLPVAQGQTAIAFIKDAIWVEPPPRLFQRLLSETIRAKTGRTVLDPRQFNMATGATLSGQLLRFDIEEKGARAVVVYDATISGEKDRPTRTRRFEARVPAGTIEARSAGDALNRAANEVAAQVADWLQA